MSGQTVRASNVSFEQNASEFIGGAVLAETDAVIGGSTFLGNRSRVGGALFANGKGASPTRRSWTTTPSVSPAR